MVEEASEDTTLATIRRPEAAHGAPPWGGGPSPVSLLHLKPPSSLPSLSLCLSPVVQSTDSNTA